MNTFSANTETLLVLAWLARNPHLYGAIIQTDPEETRRRSRDRVKTIASLLEKELPSLNPTSIYSPVYERLLRHSIARAELDILAWAIVGQCGIYFKEDHLASDTDKAREEEAARSETSVFWEEITRNEHVLTGMKRRSRQWHGDVHGGAQILKTSFRLHELLLIRTTGCSFLIQELLLLSLERIDWGEIAAGLIEAPDSAVSIQPEATMDAVKCAILSEGVEG